jgi:hypothetical protein
MAGSGPAMTGWRRAAMMGRRGAAMMGRRGAAVMESSRTVTGSSRTVTGSSTAMAVWQPSPSVPHPRIEHGVQDVDAEIDQYIDAGDHQQRALDDRVIPPQYRRHYEIPNAG